MKISGSTSFVELKEDFMSGDTAVNFLKGLAGNYGVRCDKKLFSMLEEDKNYLAPNLHTLFDTWYDQKLKTSVYPQYCAVKTTDQTVLKSAPKGSAYTELMEMIGLAEAKKIIRQALAYAKAQKLFSEKGMSSRSPVHAYGLFRESWHSQNNGRPALCQDHERKPPAFQRKPD